MSPIFWPDAQLTEPGNEAQEVPVQPQLCWPVHCDCVQAPQLEEEHAEVTVNDFKGRVSAELSLVSMATALYPYVPAAPNVWLASFEDRVQGEEKHVFLPDPVVPRTVISICFIPLASEAVAVMVTGCAVVGEEGAWLTETVGGVVSGRTGAETVNDFVPVAGSRRVLGGAALSMAVA